METFHQEKDKAGLRLLIYPKKAILSLNLAVLVKIVVFGRLHKMIFNQLNKKQNKSRAKRGLFWLNLATTMTYEQGN